MRIQVTKILTDRPKCIVLCKTDYGEAYLIEY